MPGKPHAGSRMRPITYLMTLARPMSGRLPIGSISRAAFKFAGSIARKFGTVPTAANWVQRAEVCERCPLRTIQCGKSYCGKPFLQQPVRDPAVDGCGCPTHAKAQDPDEHCPLNERYGPAGQTNGTCDCRWCRLAVLSTPVRH